MAQYMLLLRSEGSGFQGMSPEQIQGIIQKYTNWRTSLQDRIALGKKLKDGEGQVLRKNGGKPSVTDGPYVEAKEVMGGFFVIEADSYEQAVEVAKTCPHMDFGSIEIRAVERTAERA